MRIEQRSAAVAGIDGGIGLDHAFHAAVLFGFNGAVERADDAGGQRAFKAERVADGQHLLPHHQVVGIAQAQGRQLAPASILISARSLRGSVPSTLAL